MAFGAFDTVKDYVGRIPEAWENRDFSPEMVNKAMSEPWEPFRATEYLSRVPQAIGNAFGGGGEPSSGIAALLAEPEVITEGGIADALSSPQTVFPGKQVQGTGTDPSAAAMLKAMYGMESDPVPDMADLMAEQRKDAYSNALVQLGAGIAGDDLAGGLSRAGTVAFQGRQDARDLDLKARMAQYTADRGDIDRDIEILGKAGLIEAQQFRNEMDRRIQAGRNENETMRFVKSFVADALKDAIIETREGQTMAEARTEYARALYMYATPRSILTSRGLNYFLDDEKGTDGGKRSKEDILSSYIK
jgi:hypothetical protein